jgi:HSP20 family protein
MVIDFSSYYTFPSQIDKLFEEYARPFFSSQRGFSYPPLQVSEDEHAIVVRAEIPGVAMEDLDLTLTNKSLVLKGERSVEKGRYYRQERPTGAFQRIVQLGTAVDRDAIRATLSDGILTITLPKSEEYKPRKISIAAE